jgi:recombination protein RecA
MDAAQAKDHQVERLRQEIRKLQAAPRRYLAALRTGIRMFDELLPTAGLPLGQALELWGEAASGRTTLALRALASATQESRLAAYVDGPGELYPLAAAALGVELSRLLIVRPKAPGKLVWTAVQLARSGAFACVALDLTHTAVRLSLAECKKLSDAACRGGCCLLMLTPPEAPGDGMIRLEVSASGVQGVRVEVQRSRQGRTGAQALISWASLYPLEPPRFRCREHPGSPGCSEGDSRFSESPVRRTKLSWPRDVGGIARSRPGRDAALPELCSSLGL